MKFIASLFALVAVSAAGPVFAQKGPCTEDSVRVDYNSGHAAARTDDYYLFNPLLDKPAIGAADFKKAQQTMATESGNRKNVKTDTELTRVIAAPSGEMAYAFGETHFSFDESDSGKHVDRTTAFLSVWRADGGECKLAAAMIQREGQR